MAERRSGPSALHELVYDISTCQCFRADVTPVPTHTGQRN